VSPDRAWFESRLHERNQEPERAARIDEEIWREAGREVTVMATDMSGFTRITKQRGLIHFLAMFVEGRRLARPIVERHGGAVVKSEADNMLNVFDDVGAAVRAAAEIRAALDALNAAEPDEDARAWFCIGIDHGRVIRLDDDLFGDAVNVAYKLGEDVAKRREVLLGDAAHAALPAIDGIGVGERRIEATGGVELGYWPLDFGD